MQIIHPHSPVAPAMNQASLVEAPVDFDRPSGAGKAVLHWLVGALHFVLELLGVRDIRWVCRTGLDRFMAPSYGTPHGLSVAREEAGIAFGQETGHRLGQAISARQLTACEDETFHPAPCLLETGAPHSTETVAANLKQPMETLKTLAQQVGLSGRCRQKPDTFRRRLPDIERVAGTMIEVPPVLEAITLKPVMSIAEKERIVTIPNVKNGTYAAGKSVIKKSNPAGHTIRHRDRGTVKINPYTRSRAIRAFCTECLGFETHPRDCTSPLCPLYPYRGLLAASKKSRSTAKKGPGSQPESTI